MTKGSLCAMGGLTPMPVQSAIRHWPEDFDRSHQEEVPSYHHRPPGQLGTRARPRHATVAGETVHLTIDGQPVDVPEGTSVMRAAALVGIDVPKLCATDSMKAFGSCRMCLVEVEGGKGVPASCTTPCSDGMVVRTDTEQVQQLRRGVMELYLSDHPADCDGCARGNCEIQALATRVGSAEVRYGLGRPPARRGGHRRLQPLLRLRPRCLHRLLAVRARVRRHPGHVRADRGGRGFDSRITPGGVDFLSSECVSCGACVQACPTDALAEKSLVELGMPTRSVDTTCAYCGVGCSFRAEVSGVGDDTRVVRMIPSKDGGANEGHSCVKGRFAYGYASHDDRQMHPMVRDSIEDEWRVVSWEEAIARVAEGFQAIQAEHGVGTIGGISSSRCTNEEVYVVQKMVRAAFGNNNIDTCARVCHSPTGYGLNQTFGTSAGTQDFKSVESADVILLIGANPTDAHPVFASRMKRVLRQGAQIIVADPRRIDIVRTPHIEAAHHLPVLPGSNVAFVNALAHTIVTEGLHDEEFSAAAARTSTTTSRSSPGRRTPRSRRRRPPASRPSSCARRPGCTPPAPTPPSTTASASPSTARARRWSWAWPTSPWSPATSAGRASGSTRCAGRTTSRAPATWAPPPRVPGLPPRLPRRGARHHEYLWGLELDPSPACGSPTCSTPPSAGCSAGSSSRARTSPSPTPTPSTSRRRCRRWTWSWCRTCSSTRPPASPTSSCPAPASWRRTGLHQRRAPYQPGAPGLPEPGRQGRVAGGVRDRAGHGLRHH